jgi:hypothetical protein
MGKGYTYITKVSREDYIHYEGDNYWRTRLHPELNAYHYIDDDGNEKPTIFCMRWNEFGDDYLGYSSSKGYECKIIFIEDNEP